MKIRRRFMVACLLVLASFAVPASAAGLESSRVTRLSDERTLSRWSHPAWEAPVRPKPDGTTRTMARLRFDTEDGLGEVYLALRSYRHPDGSEWVEIRLPRRPNGQTGWVRRDALGRFHVVRTMLRIDRGSLRATLFRRGERIWSAPIGIGSPSTPTPAGRFYIRGKLRPPRGGIYGDLAFATSAYSSLSEWPGGGVIGVHGTNRPDLIPGRPSHGCIRLRNAAIRRLDELLPNGTPVRIV